MEAYAVSTSVNRPQNDNAQLIEPAEEWGRLF